MACLLTGFVKGLFLVCPLALAAQCSGASQCVEEHDATSFVQVQQIVKKHDSKRFPDDTFLADDWPTPVVDDEAIADATPDHLDAGSVQKAFSKAKDRVRTHIETEATKSIDFHNQVHESRRVSRQEAAEAVHRARKETKEAIAEDQKEVHAVAKKRKEVVEETIDEVKKAKEETLAHDIKKKQAEAAAHWGKKIGSIEGEKDAKRAWAEYKHKLHEEKGAAKHAREEREKHDRKMAKIKAIDAETERLAEQDAEWVKKEQEKAHATKARAAAKAGIEEERIEGPEGLRNTIDTIKAGWVVDHLERETEADHKEIKSLAR